MTKKTTDPRQTSFEYFDIPRKTDPVPGSFDFDPQLRNLLNRAIKETDISRAHIAATMTDLVFGDAGDGEVTKVQIDSWTAPSRSEWRFPLCYLPAFVHATGAVWLLDHIAGLIGCKVLVGEQALLAELGAANIAKRSADSHEKAVLKFINDLSPEAAARLQQLTGAGD